MKFTKSSVITSVLAFVLVAALAVGGTIAYFTSSDEVTNTFTMGDIAIGLTEDEWDDTTDGKEMLPGTTLYKNPTVAATEGDSYMRVKVEFIDTATGNPITDSTRIAKIMDTVYYSATAYGTEGSCIEGSSYSAAQRDAITGLVKGVNTTDFVKDNTYSTGSVYYYNYINGGNNIFSEEDGDTAILFTHIIIPTDWTREDLAVLGEYSIHITAQAVQTTGFDNAAAAYAELPA